MHHLGMCLGFLESILQLLITYEISIISRCHFLFNGSGELSETINRQVLSFGYAAIIFWHRLVRSLFHCNLETSEHKEN